MKSTLLLAGAGAMATTVDMPRVSFHRKLHLPLAGSSVAGNYNLIFVADEGHHADMAASSICDGIGNSFNATSYAPRCKEEAAASVRRTRGLALQHDPVYATAAFAMEERLGNDGYMATEFEANTFSKPFRAAFMTRVLKGMGGAEPGVYCEVGFGAGHSALLALASTKETRVHAFDAGTPRYVVPAHDYLDDKYPERLFMYLGDSQYTIPRMYDYFPGDACDVVYFDGAKGYDSIKSDLSQMQRLTRGEGHVLVLAGAGEGTDTLRAWSALVEEGLIRWEGTVQEAPGIAGSDALVYGRYTPAATAGVGADGSATTSA